MQSNNKFLLVFASILILGIAARASYLKFVGFYEPDVYIHFTLTELWVAEGHFPTVFPYTIPTIPTSLIAEPIGLYATPVFLYKILHPLGISLYTIFRAVPLFYAILTIILASILAYQLWPDKKMMLLTAFFIATSIGNMAKTSATMYRGDGFISVFLIASLICLIEIFRQPNTNRLFSGKMLAAIGSGVFLAVGTLIWDGYTFIIVVWLLAALSIVAFFIWKKKSAENIYFISIAFAIFFMLFAIFLYFNLPAPLGKGLNVALPNNSTLSSAGSGTHSFIEELLYPTPTFLIASLGMSFIYNPIAWPLFLDYFVPLAIIAILIVIASIFYLLIDLNPNQQAISRKLSTNVGPALLSILAYLIIVTYLQATGERFNGLMSIPYCIIAAYTTLWILRTIRYKGVQIAFLVLIIAYYLAITAWHVKVIKQDNTNPQLLQAVDYLHENTNINSTVLTFWPDGSLVAGWANRRSFAISLGVEEPPLPLQEWYLNTTNNTAALAQYQPTYILVRYYELSELYSVCEQFGLKCPVSNNAYKETNIYKMLYVCNSTCLGGALQLVYQNNDTKIYRVMPSGV